MNTMSNTAGNAQKSQSRHVRELDRRLGALELREEGRSPGCHSPFQYSSEEEDTPAGSTLPSENQRRLGAQRSALGQKNPEASKKDPAALSQSRSSLAQRSALGQKNPETSKRDSAALSKSRSSLSFFVSPETSKKNDGAWGKLIVGEGPRFRIHKADSSWLLLFGFNTPDVQNKSLLIAAGPKTKMHMLSQLFSSASPTTSVPVWATLYAKSGAEIPVMVRASMDNDEGHIAVEMKSLAAASSAAHEEDLVEEEAPVVG